MKDRPWIFSLCLPLLVLTGCAGEPPPDADTLEISASQLQELESLGYINSAEVSAEEMSKRGVVLWDRERSSPGFNLYSSGAHGEARLISMGGELVHRWSSSAVGRAFELFQQLGHPPWYMNGWERLWLGADGRLTVNGSHHMLLSLAPNSSVELKVDIPVHHDFAIAEDGRIYLIVDVPRMANLEGTQHLVTDNQIVVLDPSGAEDYRLSVLDALLASPEHRPVAAQALRGTEDAKSRRVMFFERALRGAEGELEIQLTRRYELFKQALNGDLETERELKAVLLHHPATDILHTNSIQLTPSSIDGLWPQGAILLCINHLNLLAVLDPDSGKILWSWGRGELDLPHHASQVEGGTILLFDNGPSRKFSRVLEIDPRSGAIVWEYRANPPESFFSSSRGGAQVLDNDNVLITETDRGRTFEATRAGEIVWEFHNPDVAENRRATIYRMYRVPERF